MMRSGRLRPALAVAATLVALVPTSASAAHPKGLRQLGASRCAINEFIEPHVVTSGESVQIFGQLRCLRNSAGANNQQVNIYEHSNGVPGFKIVATATTSGGGFYSAISPDITADSRFYVSALGTRSGNRFVRVAPQVKLISPPENTQLLTGRSNRVTFTGTVTPADTGAEVLLQREASSAFEEWIIIQRGVVTGGTFSLTHTFVFPGDANLRVVVRPHGQFTVRGISNTMQYDISQAQNPSLTIASSANPIFYGQPLTISGKGPANQQLTLQSRPRGVVPFSPVAKTTSNGSGEYKFVIPSALASAFYRVSGGGVTSAVLFEGVKYLLTAGASTLKTQAGQPVTFSGTVTPVHAGHPVYLERENTFGGGFHVIEVGTVSAGGTYSITHVLFGGGKQVYRVKVPGDPENQTAGSGPFTIEVTPAPPFALHPVTQGPLPNEGQH